MLATVGAHSASCASLAFATAFSIPANTYEGQTAAVPTAAVVNYLVTHSGVKDETVYQMTKAVYESLPDLAAAHTTTLHR